MALLFCIWVVEAFSVTGLLFIGILDNGTPLPQVAKRYDQCYQSELEELPESEEPES